MKRTAAVIATAIVALSTLAISAPADGTSWGCGGRPCRVAGR